MRMQSAGGARWRMPESRRIDAADGRSQLFDDAAGYDAYMGRWSRLAAAAFLEWLRPPLGATWLEVGCGTGALTRLVTGRASPASLTGVDRELGLIRHARRNTPGSHVDWRVADAVALPFADGAFDIVASGLVLNFVQDPVAAVLEMRRVARVRGTVAAYVWDFAGRRSPSDFLRAALMAIGVVPQDLPGTELTSLSALESLFAKTGLQGAITGRIDVAVQFDDAEQLCQALKPSFGPRARVVAGLAPARRLALERQFPVLAQKDADGRFTCSARAHAIRAVNPRSCNESECF